MHGVEQTVLREFRVKHESDEAALEPVVYAVGKNLTDVRIYVRLIALIEQIQETARIVREPAAVGQITHVAHARPT